MSLLMKFNWASKLNVAAICASLAFVGSIVFDVF